MILDLRWIRRNLKQPADDLTNFTFEAFDPSLRIEVSWAELEFRFLHTLGRESVELSDQLAVLRSDKVLAGASLPQEGPRRKKLRETDPW